MDIGCKLFQKHLDKVINVSWNFAGRCDTEKDQIMNAVLGLAGEAGEVTDQVKKWFFHSPKPEGFHREKLVSEVGDVLFYLIKFMELTNITVTEALEVNRAKLESRHPELGVVKERFGEGYIK